MLRGGWRGKGKKEKSSQNPGNDYFSRDTQPIKRLKKPFRIASVQTVLRGKKCEYRAIAASIRI